MAGALLSGAGEGCLDRRDPPHHHHPRHAPAQSGALPFQTAQLLRIALILLRRTCLGLGYLDTCPAMPLSSLTTLPTPRIPWLHSDQPRPFPEALVLLSRAPRAGLGPCSTGRNT